MHDLPPKPLTDDRFASFRYETDAGSIVYAAGYPTYQANFTRDTIIAGIIANSADLLISQLEYSADNQGAKIDILTGESPGKIHHQLPGAQLEGRGNGLTTYNACDTTALFLIGAEGLSRLDEAAYGKFLAERRSNLEKAANHVISLVGDDDQLYWDKAPTKDTAYTLRVTYWKDSILPRLDGKLVPTYPVSFGQAHFIAARGLLSASRILEEPAFAQTADRMFRAGISAFIQQDNYVIYKDAEGELKQVSSDELHSLAYIPAQYGDILPLQAISQRATAIATPYGYICTPYSIARLLSDRYHGDKIWAFEQAVIHYGAIKFGLIPEAVTAAAISQQIGDGQELFGIRFDAGKLILIPEGNNRQLWSIAAAEYFTPYSVLPTDNWL